MVETMMRETNSDGNYDDGVGSVSFAKRGSKQLRKMSLDIKNFSARL